MAAAVIIGSIIATAFAMIIGAIILGETHDIAGNIIGGNATTSQANATVEAMFDIIWPSLNLLPLQILVLVGAAIMAAVGLFLARG